MDEGERRDREEGERKEDELGPSIREEEEEEGKVSTERGLAT